jgi:hypothetical protein
MSADQSPTELSREHMLAIIRDQQDHIERLRSMLWTAAGVDENEPPMTEADYQAIVANPANESLADLIAEIDTTFRDYPGDA